MEQQILNQRTRADQEKEIKAEKDDFKKQVQIFIVYNFYFLIQRLVSKREIHKNI